MALRPNVLCVLVPLAACACTSTFQGNNTDAGTDADPSAPDAAPAPDAPPGSPDGGPVTGCQTLGHEAGVSVGGYVSDRYSWYDADCKLRTAALVHNDATDPGGSHGGFLRELTYDVAGSVRHCVASAGTWNGWGYVVNHYASTAATSHDVGGSYRTVLAGRHHAIHEFTLSLSPGGQISVTIHWLFATGRTNPVYAITFDASPAGANVVTADTRAPYGNLNFDGVADGSGQVAGLGWGDQYRFTTTGAGPVTLESPWDYSQPNTVPYVVEWAGDGEMGAVQTQSFGQHVAGGDYGGGMLAACQGHTSASPGTCSTSGHVMLTDWLWPYQLNQYELPYVTTSKRLAWGATFGAIGQSSYSAFGQTLSGYPRVSYSVSMVLGRHAQAPVAAAVAEIETVQHTSLTAQVGSVATTGPAGIGRSDTVTLAPAGWDARYGTWSLVAAANHARVVMNVASGTLHHPIVVVTSYSAAAPAVKLDGASLTADVDYFATVDGTGQTLWLTLLGDLAGSHTLDVQ